MVVSITSGMRKTIILTALLLSTLLIGAQPPMKFLGTYNSSGLPDYLETTNEVVSASFVDRISAALPENAPVPEFHPSYLNSGYSADIVLIEEADVFISFVLEGAGYKNVLGFYEYPTGIAPATINDIDSITIIFPNVSRLNSGGQLIAGHTVNIGHFQAGTTIGFVVFANGFNGQVTYGKWQHYSDKHLNPPADTNIKQHAIVLYDNISNRHVISFEDITRPGGDRDFNDAVFFGTTNPASAALTGSGPGLPVVWEGTENSQWENPNNWNPNIIPDSTNSVTISASAIHDPYISTNIAVEELVVEPGATLNTSPDILLNVNGDYTSFSEINGDLSFVGDTDQTIYGEAIFNDITINNNHEVKVDDNITIEGNLILVDGDLNTQDNDITLLSSNIANGMLLIENGSVNGELIFKRIIPNHTGYHYLSSPITDATLNDINDDFTLLSLGGDLTSTPFPNIFSYDETNPSTHNTDGWTVPAGLSSPMTPGIGFATYINANTEIDFTGIPNDGPVDIDLSFTFSGELAEDHPHCPPDGWNLIGNPYPSALDWEKVKEDMSDNIDLDHGIYLWNPNINQYATYINGIGTNEGTNRIAAFQGFFIRATGIDTLKLNNSHRTVDSILTTPFFRTKQLNRVNLKIVFQGKQDEVAVYTKPGATYGYDIKNDGYKMFSNDITNPQIFTVNADSIMYSVNALPEDPQEDVKVSLQIPKKGQVTISASHFYWNDLYSHPMLFDKTNGTYTDMKHNSYSFWSNDLEIKDRFSIVFRKTITNTENHKNHHPLITVKDNIVTIINISNKAYSSRIIDLQGHIVYSKTTPSNKETISIDCNNLPKGLYIIELNQSRYNTSKRFVLN